MGFPGAAGSRIAVEAGLAGLAASFDISLKLLHNFILLLVLVIRDREQLDITRVRCIYIPKQAELFIDGGSKTAHGLFMGLGNQKGDTHPFTGSTKLSELTMHQSSIKLPVVGLKSPKPIEIQPLDERCVASRNARANKPQIERTPQIE